METTTFPQQVQIRRSDSLISTDLSGDTILLSVETSETFGFEAVGSRVWELLESPTTMETLCSQLREEFDVEPERCQEDVAQFLSTLADSRLIVVESDPGA